jgi:hypothetical protein
VGFDTRPNWVVFFGMRLSEGGILFVVLGGVGEVISGCR